MKSPAFQFYPNDWSRDLEEYPLEIEGAWIRICCKLWWAEPKGCLTKNLQEWSRILRISPRQTVHILKHLLKKSICDGQYLDNQNITIISRRIVKDERIRKIRQEVGKLGGNPGLMKIRENLLNQTPNQKDQSSSSSSSLKNKTFSCDSIEMEIATLLFKEILNRKPDYKEPNLQIWAREINLMIRIDNRLPEKIKEVLLWVQKDSFWMNNILSTKKLREKFDALELKMKQSPPQISSWGLPMKEKKPW